MGIGPFTTYAPPGVYVRTVADPVIGQLLGGLRIPVLIGTAKETLSQTDFEMVRGSSSQADTPIFGEDVAGRWVSGGSPSNPALSDANGVRTQFKVRNYPITDESGVGKATFDASKVSVLVNGDQVSVSGVDGPNGLVTLLVPPQPTDVVTVTYSFRRKDTLATDDVSSQVTKGAAVLTAPKAEPYSVVLGSSDKLSLYVDDSSSPAVVTLAAGASRSATDLANDVNAAGIPGLTASVHSDAEGNSHLRLSALGNVLVGSGSANGVIGFNAGDFTARNKSFRVFNGPIVDGSDGGVTTTDPAKVVVLVNGVRVAAKSVDGSGRTVTLSAAPKDGQTVSVQYWFNAFQDTFDYLPNNGVRTVGNVGVGPSRRDYVNGQDFVVVNEGDLSKIHWGTSFQISAGEKTGLVPFDSTQVSGLLVDDRMHGAECERFTDPVTSSVSSTKFVLPLSPTTGNGRDTPLGASLYQTVSNGRMDLATNRPDLVTVHVGKTWRDAASRPAVAVTEVDSATNTVVVRDPVPADSKAFATFWYNRISDDTFTLQVVTPGASGVGQYTVKSAKTGSQVLGAKFGTKSGLSQTVQWPSGVESSPDAFHTGDGSPVAETVTVTFDNTIEPATHASFTNASAEPYDLYTASRIFGGVVVDGGSPVSVNLASAYKAALVGQPVDSAQSFDSTDRLVLRIDGVAVTVDVSAATTMALVASAINTAVDADATAHTDGTGTFSSTAPNSLASVLTYGAKKILVIKSRTAPSATNGRLSEVVVLSPTAAGQTDAAAQCGLVTGQSSTGSFNALCQPARMAGTKVGPFVVQAGVNDAFQLNVDGLDFGGTVPSGTAVDMDDFVTAINTAYMSVASSDDVTTYTTDVVALANDLKAQYNAHRTSTVFHAAADSTNAVTSANATDLATAVTLLNEIRGDYNAHLTQSGVHQLNDTLNAVSAAAATNLQSAVTLAHELKDRFNAHRTQVGVHGHDDATNVDATAAATNQATTWALLNALKSEFNAHRTQSGVHVANDASNSVTAANATDTSSAVALSNQLKAKFNLHLAQSGVHVTNDTANAVTTADSSDDTTAQALANALKAAFNAHLSQVLGSYHVHGTNDGTNAVTAAMTELVARIGLGAESGLLVLTSRVNSVKSGVALKSGTTCADLLGLTAGASASRARPTASAVAAALMNDVSFSAAAVAWKVSVQGLGGFLRIDSLSVGTASTIAFTSVSNTAFIPDTGIGIVPGTSGDSGESAVSGFLVTSSAGSYGSSGRGVPGQTYTDAKTGLRFTVLPAASGDYASGGSFTLVVNGTFTADAAVPVRAIPGLEATVYNTVNTGVGTTGLLSTFSRTGNEPRIGDTYYVSYEYAKPDMSATGLYRDLKKIQAAFGPATPEFPLSLAARLALLNGAVVVGLRQVPRSNGSQATAAAFVAAIDDQKKPMAGNVKPDIIAPLSTDPQVFAYLNQHCVFMSAPRMEGERMGIVGCAVGTTPLGAQSIARGLSSELMMLCYPDSYVVSVTDNEGNSSDQLVDGSFMAAAIAGSTCNPSVDVATPLTRRQIFGFKQAGRTLDPTEANQVAVAGVTVLEPKDNALQIRHGLTTKPDTVITRTPSVTMTIQLVQQTIRRMLDPFIGQKFSGSVLKSAESAMTAAFNGLIEQKIVAKVTSINVTVDEDDPTIMRAEAVYVPVFPLEYIVATMNVRVRI